MLIRPALAAALFLALAASPTIAQPAPQMDVAAVTASPAFAAARAKLASDYDRTVAELIRITETPAPPFKEQVRGRLYADMLRAHGLKDVTTDEEGNVTGLRPGTGGGSGKLLVVSAHLDTVFPEGTPIKVRREGDKLFAPGIGDDSLGLASLLAWIRAMDAAGIKTRDDILFVGTVGEEGQGDLRGVRHFFTKGRYKDRVGAFLSVDGSDVTRITHGGVGSRRYRIVFKGPGGHSYGAFGLVNPMAAMADMISRMYRISTPADPKTTFSASVVGGGTSVNTIPSEVFIEIDMRSKDPAALQRLEKRVLAVVAEAVAAENHARSTASGEVSAEPKLIGDRPAGQTELGHPLVQQALAAVRAQGLEPRPDASSTDANIPMSLGIPALTISSGAGGGRAHAPDEYVVVTKEPFVRGLTVGLTLILAAAGTH